LQIPLAHADAGHGDLQRIHRSHLAEAKQHASMI
jgi:hypothetical protein